MSNTETTTPTEKVSVADRKLAANDAFVVGGDALAIAEKFAVVPNGREFVDVTYNARVAELSAAFLEHPEMVATFAADLLPLANLREAVLAAMPTSTAKAERVIDPAEKRAADVEKFGTLSAIAQHLHDAQTWVDLMLGDELDDLTDNERAEIADADVPTKVTDATERIAKFVNAIVAEKSVRGRDTVSHDTPAVGTILTRGGKGEGTSAEVVAEGDGVAYVVNGEKLPSISAAATAVNGGGSINGWKFFGLA